MNLNPFNNFFIRVHSRSFFFNANGREYPQISANRILRKRG